MASSYLNHRNRYFVVRQPDNHVRVIYFSYSMPDRIWWTQTNNRPRWITKRSIMVDERKYCCNKSHSLLHERQTDKISPRIWHTLQSERVVPDQNIRLATVWQSTNWDSDWRSVPSRIWHTCLLDDETERTNSNWTSRSNVDLTIWLSAVNSRWLILIAANNWFPFQKDKREKYMIPSAYCMDKN